MYKIKRFIVFSIVLMISVAALLFLLENQQPVSLVFVGWSTPQWAVSIYIFGALLLGLAVGPLLGSIVVLRSEQRYKRKLAAALKSS